MAEIERWITVNGAHIPIMRGESATKAVGNFIRKRRDKKVSERKDYVKKVLGTPGYGQDDEGLERDIRHEMRDQRKSIKGVRKSNEQITKSAIKEWNDFSNKANKYIDSEEHWNKYLDKQEKALKKLDNARNSVKNRKDYNKSYKLKADNYKLSKAESKLQDFAQTSKSEYNISNIKAKELPLGAIHITTKSGKDISTISPKALTAAEKNDLRRKGILK